MSAVACYIIWDGTNDSGRWEAGDGVVGADGPRTSGFGTLANRPGASSARNPAGLFVRRTTLLHAGALEGYAYWQQSLHFAE